MTSQVTWPLLVILEELIPIIETERKIDDGFYSADGLKYAVKKVTGSDEIADRVSAKAKMLELMAQMGKAK